MAAIILTQTDTAAQHGAQQACSGRTPAATADAKQATEGGTAGITELAADVPALETVSVLMFETASGEPNKTTWESGDYVVRINVTTAQMDLTWEETYVCERDDAGVFTTVASVTAQATNIGAGGTFSHTVNRATDYAPKNADSQLYFVLVFANANEHTLRSLAITPDQNIDTPLESSATGRIMSSLVSAGGLVASGGLAGSSGGLAG